MRRVLIAVAVMVAALAVAAVVHASVTKDFTFKSTGKATQPGAVSGVGSAGTYEDIPFTIAAGDADGTVSITLNWTNQVDDWDLYVYRKDSSGNLIPVANSGLPVRPRRRAASGPGEQGGMLCHPRVRLTVCKEFLWSVLPPASRVILGAPLFALRSGILELRPGESP